MAQKVKQRQSPDAKEFTANELLAAQRALRKQYLPKSNNIVDIGFGPAITEPTTATRRASGKTKIAKSSKKQQLPKPYRIDPTRAFCAKFFVKRKWKSRPNREDLIPREVEFTINRRGKKIRFAMPTDVVRFYVPRLTGTKIRVPGDHATAGVAVRWREVNSGATVFWAVVTVGHLFNGFASGTGVTLSNKGIGFSGTLMGVAPALERVDGAVVEVIGADLKIAGIVTGSAPTAKVLSIPELAALNGFSGQSLRDPTPKQIEFLTLFPDTQNFPSLGDRVFVIEGRSNTTLCFEGGTSGSAWRRLTSGAAIQIGGTPGLQFRQGFAQAATTVLAWAESFIKKRRQVATSSFVIAAVF